MMEVTTLKALPVGFLVAYVKKPKALVTSQNATT
jgi:hypothetical protein